MPTITYSIRGPLPSRANERLHWSKRRKVSSAQRLEAYALTLAPLMRRPLRLPVAVTLTRVSPRLLDEDNLQGAFKSVRDGIADAFKVDDSPGSPISWQYAQRKGSPARAEIEIEEK